MELQHTATAGTTKQVIVPRKLYKELGLRRGEYLKVERHGRQLILKPNMIEVLDIEARIAEGLKDIEEGRTYGPFASVKAMLRSLHSHTKQKKVTKRRSKKQ